MLSVAACIGQWKWVYISSKPRKLSDIDVIDEASRGPLGSIQMIATIPWGWATLGAIITILALGIDSFAQEVISTELVSENVNDGTASFKVARDYFTDAKVSGGGGDYGPDREQNAAFFAEISWIITDLCLCVQPLPWILLCRGL